VPAPSTVLAICSLGVFMAFVDATIVNIAFPDIAQSFPATDIAALSWVLNAYNIVFAAFLVAAGRIADLIGRRRVFLAGILVFTGASGLCGAASSVEMLVFFRVLQAIGAALLVPASLGLVLQAFPVERRAHAVALLSAVAALAAGVGPSLGGFLVSAESWRLVFLVNLPLGVIAFVLSRKALVESREPGRRRLPDLLGTLVFAVAIATLVLAVVQGDSWGWTSPETLASFALAAALGTFFVWRSSRHRSPVIDLDLLRHRTFAVANAMTIVAAAGFFGYTLVNVLYLVGVWQYSILEAGLAITPGPLVAVVVAGPSSKLAERVGHRPVLVAGGLIWGAAVYWFVQRVGLTPDYVGEWLPGMIMLGLGAGILFPNLSGAAVASAPGEAFATATGINSVARQLGAALGVALVVAILGTPGPAEVAAAFDSAWAFCAACLAVAGLGCLAIGSLRGEDAVAKSPSLTGAARLLFRPPDPPDIAEPMPAAEPSEPGRQVPAQTGRPETDADFFGRVPIFAGLPESARTAIADSSTPVRVSAGEWLFHAGEEAEVLYVVRAGRLEVVDEETGSVMRVLGRGSALGELALLTSMPRSASVRAARTSDLIAIDREHFERLLSEEASISVALTRAMGAQLRDSVGTTAQSRSVPVTIALVGLDRAAGVDELAQRLLDSLSRWGRVDALDGESEASVTASRPSAAFGPKLDAAEAANDQLLLVGGFALEPDPWTEYCMQQADRILAIGTGADSPPEGDLPPELTGCDLVAVGIDEGSGALNGWASTLQPLETHAIRGKGTVADVDRMARRLSGNSVGIVLSGGGARAFSHIGVVDELTRAGIVIDRFAGVSMGALLAAMFGWRWMRRRSMRVAMRSGSEGARLATSPCRDTD